MATAARVRSNNLTPASLTTSRLHVSATKCWRCDGLMVIEPSIDLTGHAGHLECLARRCVQCGEIVDPIILQNRRLQFENSFGVDPRSQ